MIWGVGTGRCGTKSLAKELGGVHEPEPWYTDEPKTRWLTGVESYTLKEMIKYKAQLDTPIVVDFKSSYMIGLILRVDPGAKFIWIIREPVQCIKSLLKGKWYGDTDKQGENLLEPWMGFNRGVYDDSRFHKCCWYYHMVNEHIYRYKRYVSAVYFTEDLEVHENKYPADITIDLTDIELDYIHKQCDSIYQKAREL